MERGRFGLSEYFIVNKVTSESKQGIDLGRPLDPKGSERTTQVYTLWANLDCQKLGPKEPCFWEPRFEVLRPQKGS